MTETNWAGNIAYGATSVVSPDDVDAVRRLVLDATPGSLRPLGTRHSFSPIADTTGVLVSSAAFSSPEQVRVADDRTERLGTRRHALRRARGHPRGGRARAREPRLAPPHLRRRRRRDGHPRLRCRQPVARRRGARRRVRRRHRRDRDPPPRRPRLRGCRGRPSARSDSSPVWSSTWSRASPSRRPSTADSRWRASSTPSTRSPASATR